jgi:hypothetical protein
MKNNTTQPNGLNKNLPTPTTTCSQPPQPTRRPNWPYPNTQQKPAAADHPYLRPNPPERPRTIPSATPSPLGPLFPPPFTQPLQPYAFEPPRSHLTHLFEAAFPRYPSRLKLDGICPKPTRCQTLNTALSLHAKPPVGLMSMERASAFSTVRRRMNSVIRLYSFSRNSNRIVQPLMLSWPTSLYQGLHTLDSKDHFGRPWPSLSSSGTPSHFHNYAQLPNDSPTSHGTTAAFVGTSEWRGPDASTTPPWDRSKSHHQALHTLSQPMTLRLLQS